MPASTWGGCCACICRLGSDRLPETSDRRMATILGSIPYIDCLVRKEYTQDLQAGAGEYIEAKAIGVLCIRGDSLQFQVVMKEPYAGCAFLLPIEALVTRPCPPAPSTKIVQPWDCFSSEFGVCELATVRRGAVKLLKDGVLGEYRFSIAFTGSDLADDPAQRKLLHVVLREDGLVGAYPNNRMVFLDRALFGDLEPETRLEFTTLSREFRAEGLSRSHDIQETHGPAGGVLPGLRESQGPARSRLERLPRRVQYPHEARRGGVGGQTAAQAESDQAPNSGD